MFKLVTTMLLVTGPLVLLPAGATGATKECHGQVATVVGTDGNDKLVDDSDPARDVVWLGPGNDTWTSHGTGADIVCGGKGSDWLSGGFAAHLLIGGDGSDEFYEFAPHTVALGGPGDDDFEQTGGKAYGGPGNDMFVNHAGESFGGLGDDSFNVQKYDTGALHGNRGRDGVMFFYRNLHVNLTRGTAWWNGGRITLDGMEGIVGTKYADVLIGSPQGDVLEGVQGKDLIKGRAGNDNLSTQDGDGGTIYGGTGYDICSAPHTYGCEKVW